MKSVAVAVTLFVIAAVVLLLAIAFANWTLVTAPVPVDLFVTTVALPLPFLLLAGLVLVVVAYVATVGRVRVAAVIESRDLHRELDRARRTAESAEASRIAELKAYLDREIPEIELKLDHLIERHPDAGIDRPR